MGLFLAFALIFAVSFALYRLPLAAVLYPAGLCLLLGAGYAVAGFLRVRKRHAALEGKKKGPARSPRKNTSNGRLTGRTPVMIVENMNRKSSGERNDI